MVIKRKKRTSVNPNRYRYNCQECGKEMPHILHPDYVYKIVISNVSHYYCSYHCWMAAKRRMGRIK